MQPALQLVALAPPPRSPEPPFWGRCARACAMLLVASATHQWLLPPAASPSPGTPIPAPRAPLAPPSDKLIAGAADTVQVVSQLVSAVTGSMPVGTSGLVPRRLAPLVQAATTASFDAPPAPRAVSAAMDQPSPSPQPEPPAALAVAPAELPADSPSVTPPAAPGADGPALGERAVPAPVPVDQQELVRRLLDRYADAYGRLDVTAAKAVWPTLDDKALRRAFAQLEAQQVTFDSCGITIDGQDAHARCAGQASYRPRVGSRELRSAAREWTFDLAQAQNGWRIVDARVR